MKSYASREDLFSKSSPKATAVSNDYSYIQEGGIFFPASILDISSRGINSPYHTSAQTSPKPLGKSPSKDSLV
jgi:hypothetical protein